MYKIMELDKFIVESNKSKNSGDIIAMHLITPNQSVFAKACIPSIYDKVRRRYNINHIHIFNYLLFKLYGISCDDEVAIEALEDLLRNFITIDYVAFGSKSERDKSKSGNISCYIKIPKYITQNQLDDLTSINEILKINEIETSVLITGYNPIDKKHEPGFKSFHEVDNELDKALEWLIDNNHIKEYDLSFSNEIIINKNKVKRLK